MKLSLLIAFSFTISSVFSQSDSTLTLVFGGDIMGHDAQITGAYVDSSGGYDYEPTFRYIADYIADADLAIGNLEVTMAGKPFKGYPQFSSPDELAQAAFDAGFDIMLTANNHSLDRKEKGLVRTKKVLDSIGFIHLGTYIDSTERAVNYPLIIEKDGFRLALLNYTYGTNGIKVKQPYIVNRIDTNIIRQDLMKAKLADPDYIICTIHWGIEYQRDENATQQKIARSIFHNGADAIIGSHPHVVQPIKYIACTDGDTIINKPVVYCLGNFVSNQRARYKDGGIMAEMHLSKLNGKCVLDSMNYLPYWVYRHDNKAKDKSTFFVLPVSHYEQDSALVDLNDNDVYRFKRFAGDTRSHISGINETLYYVNKFTDKSGEMEETDTEMLERIVDEVLK